MRTMFVCDECGTVDSTAVTDPRCAPPYKCAECLTGRWHNYFPKRAYDPAKDDVINRIKTNPDGTSISLG